MRRFPAQKSDTESHHDFRLCTGIDERAELWTPRCGSSSDEGDAIMMKEIPLSKAFHLVEPGPVVLVTTVHKGCPNIMTLSWHMVMEFEPPLIGCVIGPWDHSFTALRATGECVLAIPTVDLASKVVEIGNCSGQDVEKFEAFGLTPVPAKEVAPPLIAECLGNLECRVADTTLVGKHSLFILEVVKAWTDPECKERRTIHHNGDGTFVVDGGTINLQEKMVKWQSFL
jgi:flavin reductase (DIM6/NTAB) family NADH-FMN oxidoreductase RutF